MFGGGISWFYRYLAGMNPDPDKPGYKHIVFKPMPPKDITFASYSNFTPYGTAAISWRKDESSMTIDFTVPVGSTATVWIPASSENNVSENGRKIIKSETVSFRQMKDGYAIYNIASGEYSFRSAMTF